MSTPNESCSGSDMPEEPENWWEITPEEGKEEVGDSPKPVMISGYEEDGDQWVKRKAKDTVVPSSGDSSRGPFSDWFPEDSSNYSKQHTAATALFFFSFLVGDWWWDGSNGFGALMNSIDAVLDMPGSLIDSYEFWISQVGFNALDAILITISWSLWDISTLVFFGGFVLSWRGGDDSDPNPEGKSIRNGKKSYIFLLYFSVALISMDILSYVVWSGLLEVIEWPFDFLEWHFWQAVAILAVIGLNPDNDLWERFTSQSAKD